MINCLPRLLLSSLRPGQMYGSMEPLRQTILVVDDTPENLHLLSSALEERGYEVCVTKSGATALARIEEIMPDLILLDVLMPEMDGYAVCEQIKANSLLRTIPVIFISAADAVIDKVRAFNTGGADYITKPFQLEEALARVDHQLHIRSLQRQLEERNIELQQEVRERKQTEHQLAVLNANLEQEVQARAAKLQVAHSFEATLKRITDRVRDSLDEHQIVQAAVQELALAVSAAACNAALYDLSQQTSTVRYEYTSSQVQFRGRVLQMRNFPEIYTQLLRGISFQFCSLAPHPHRGSVTMLACPILDDQNVIGDLWLISESDRPFDEPEISLVQQVATQCAIALRQARLYQAAQAQVEELERLNQLKDDFLNTISHELRTPMSNIRMAAQLLEMSLRNSALEQSPQTAFRYLQILKDECEREISLINDLLDLCRLDANSDPLFSTTVSLQSWVPHTLEAFVKLAESQQQALTINVAKDLPPITTDFSYLGKILVELLQNACKFSPSGEAIAVSVTRMANDARVQIMVENSGVEIPSNELPRIFDRFYRVPSTDPWKHSGTGLGLALVRRRVEQLQGSITVSSTEGLTRFTIQLPFSV